VPATLKGETLTIPLGAIAPGFVAPKFEVPINGFTYSTGCWPQERLEVKTKMMIKESLYIKINHLIRYY
jgi:hypothetical protein